MTQKTSHECVRGAAAYTFCRLLLLGIKPATQKFPPECIWGPAAYTLGHLLLLNI